MEDNHNRQKIDDRKSGCGAKLRAFIAGLTPATVFKYTFVSSVIVALAAEILYRTASESLHVNIDKMDTASIDLTGSENLGGIEPGGYSSLNYSITNKSTKEAYVFVRVGMNTVGLYEVVDTDWCRVTEAENSGELIYGYGTAAAMTPVGIGEEVIPVGQVTLLGKRRSVFTAYR